MSVWGWILIVIGALVLGGGIAWFVATRRRRAHLRSRFGPEYNRVVSNADSKREAELQLAEREERRERLEIRPLSSQARTHYTEEWRIIQAEFVDEPGPAVSRADGLLQKIMQERGYPMERFEARAAILSVDHPQVVENYREGHRLATGGNGGEPDTEDLRQAMRHYRALFDELVAGRSEQRVA